MPPVQGRVSRTTPVTARTTLRLPPGLSTETVSGPRNSSALAVPSGMRAIASMKGHRASGP